MRIGKTGLRSLIALAVVMTWSSPCAFQQPGGFRFVAPGSNVAALTLEWCSIQNRRGAEPLYSSRICRRPTIGIRPRSQHSYSRYRWRGELHLWNCRAGLPAPYN